MICEFSLLILAADYIHDDCDNSYFIYYCLISQRRLITIGQCVEVDDIHGIEGATGQDTGSPTYISKCAKARTQCALQARSSDPCNVATVNAVGVYTAQIATSAASAAVTDGEYIHSKVERVGYGNQSFSRWAFD